MKPSTLIATGAALAGFSLGWLIKPSGAPAPETVETAPEAGRGSRGGLGGKSGERPERPLVLKARQGSGSLEGSEEMTAAERNFQVSFSSAGERSSSAKLNRLSEALGLSDEQRRAMDSLLAGRREGFKELQGKGKTPSEMVAEAANAARIFEKEVATILDEEQKLAYEDLKAREKENDIEAKAADEFADLVRQIDLSPAQRDQAMEALRALSTESFAKRPEGWDVMAESMEMMGGLYHSAFEEMSGFLDDPEAMKNPAEIQKRMNEANRVNSEAKIARLTTILTPAQLAQFRATLDARSNFRETSPVPPAPSNR